MTNTKYTQELTQKFTIYSGRQIDICADIVKYIDAAPPDIQGNLFAVACKSYGIVKSQKTYVVESSGITDQAQAEMRDMYGDVIDALLETYINSAIKSRHSENEFYENIWRNIVCNSLFLQPNLHTFALYYILIDKRIPFFLIDTGLEMKNDEFRKSLKDCQEDVQKIKFILALDFEQKTQEASNLLDIILKEDSYEKKVVLLAKIISELRTNDDNHFMQELLEKIE